MKLLIVSQYFWPETFIINDLARKFVAQGHNVVVATAKPNYPDGEVFTGYRAWGTQRECFMDGIDVFRVPIWPRGKGGGFNLALNYFSFVLFGLFCFPWLLRSHSFDAILVFAPSPITQVLPAIFLKWLKRTHLAVWVQDLWPESLVATGFVRNAFALSLVGHMVRWIYAMSDTLLLQSKGFFVPMSKRTEPEKLIYFPNSIDPDAAARAVETLPAELSQALANSFSVVFAGNIGKAQAVEMIVETAALLRNEANIRLVLIGSGSMLNWVRDQKTLLNLDNLLLPGRYPAGVMPQVFEKASVLLVSLKNAGTLRYTVPSKIQAYLASGRPIIASIEGEGAKVVIEAGAGLTCEAENAVALAACIRRLHALTKEERNAMGHSGRNYFYEHFDMNRQATRLMDILRERLSRAKE